MNRVAQGKPSIEAQLWLTAQQAAERLQVGRKLLYRAVRDGRLRAARIGARDLRFKPEWIDAYAESCAPQEVGQ